MFDDYDFKGANTRINMRFRQVKEETIYPWEIANFLTELNTSYYKYELLNSIASAINNGISPSDIFIFDSSLPLYKRYSDLDLVNASVAADIFYRIGRPYPLKPDINIYNLNLLYAFFSEVNSFLCRNRVKPLLIKKIRKAHSILLENGLSEAEKYIVDIAYERVSLSKCNANEIKVAEGDIEISLSSYYKSKDLLFSDLAALEGVDEASLDVLESSKKIQDRRRLNIYLKFFYYFRKTSRPLVCARVEGEEFRVLGRSLVNKAEKNGLELIQATRNSPFMTEVQGGLSLLQTVLGFGNAREMQRLQIEEKRLQIEEKKLQIVEKAIDIDLKEKQSKKVDLEIAKLELEVRKLSNEVEVQEMALNAASQSDVFALEEMVNSPTKKLLDRTYKSENCKAGNLLESRGLTLETESVRVIDTKV